MYNPLNGESNGDEADGHENGDDKNGAIEQLEIEIPYIEPITKYLAGPALSITSETHSTSQSICGRGQRQEGQRNLQDSTFSISGKRIYTT